MSAKIKDRLIGGLLFISIALGVERAAHTYFWAGQINNEAKAAYSFLAEPVGKDKSGRVITRAQIIAAFVEQAKRQAESQGRPSAAGDSR